ncbi:hypothetical protein [Streptomyces buecherae]|uniref:hypothetical protein n=1 Tax=Streptomyces buecherae TaxID=2763006 RepID=UPI0037A9D44D
MSASHYEMSLPRRDIPEQVWSLLTELNGIGYRLLPPPPLATTHDVINREKSVTVKKADSRYVCETMRGAAHLLAVWDTRNKYATGLNVSDWHTVQVDIRRSRILSFKPARWSRAFDALAHPYNLHPEGLDGTDRLARWESTDWGETWDSPAKAVTGEQVNQELAKYVYGIGWDGRLVTSRDEIKVLPGHLWSEAPAPGWCLRYARTYD